MSENDSNDSKPATLTFVNIKPSVFCSSLESFSKYSVYRGKSLRPDLADLEDQDHEDNDPALSNWEKWQKVHKIQQKCLSSKLKRPPQCMVMNSNLNNLYVNQEKNVLSKAVNRDFCDKYRGHQNFWQTGDTFRNDGKSLGTYQPIEYRYDRSHPKLNNNRCPNQPMKEYVGVPDKIFEEKKLSGEKCLPSPKSNWDRSAYVKRREEELRDKLQTIREHKPDLSEVIVIGKSLKRAISPKLVEKLEPSDSIAVSTKTETSTCFEPSPPASSISVKIDEDTIHSESALWLVFFGEEEVGKVLEKCITLKNIGNSCVRYSWEIVFPNWTDCELPLVHVKLQNKTFFFDKNDGSILPGEEKSVKVQFKSDVAGVFCEKWEIRFCHSADIWTSFIVDLQAVAVNESEKNIKAIDSYLESCTRLSIARKSVEELLKRSRPVKPAELPYNWKFYEEEIFLHNNPELFYDNKLVHKLKNIHSAIAKGPWDYSVSGLRNRLLEKTVSERKTNELETLMSTIYQLMKPNNFKCYIEKDRYQTVYDLLCCFANQVEVESLQLKITIGLPLRCLDLDKSEIELNSTSVISAKPSSRMSTFSKKNLSKKSLQKSKSSLKNQSIGSVESTSFSSWSRNSESESNNNLTLKNQEYMEALFVKTYHHLSNTLDNISAILESYDRLREKSILASLKK